jgi:hypothetical protein
MAGDTRLATNKTEASELKRMGAKVHKNSGRGMVKGDGSLDEFVVDVKEYNKSFTISVDTWAKICTDTMKVDRSKSPMLQLVLRDGDRTIRLCVVEWSIEEYLLERVKNNDNS